MNTISKHICPIARAKSTMTLQKNHVIMPSIIHGDDIKIYRSIEHLSEDWDIAAPSDNIFLQRPYLQALETAPPKDMMFRYIVIYKNGVPAGVVYCQIIHFNAAKSLGDTYKNTEELPSFWQRFKEQFKQYLANKVDFYGLICGNLLLTGEHGYHFNDSMSNEEGFSRLHEALSNVQAELSIDRIPIAVTLLKEHFEETHKDSQALIENGYNPFSIQPNMILNIREDWNSFEDYLAAMSSKYRVRVKRAFKKGKAIEKIELSEEDIKAQLPKLAELHRFVSSQVGFNTIEINPDYFLSLKHYLQDDFKLIGYYIEGECIAFFTTILNGKELEAHFLGYDKQANYANQSYMNILYDIIKIGLYNKAHKVVFARTALEIKSSAGAEAYEMHCYMRHRNGIYNRMIGPLFDYLNPPLEWTPRSPFKEISK